MSIVSRFFNSIDQDRPYDADDWGNWFSALITNGVCGADHLVTTTNEEQDSGDGAGIVYVSTGSVFMQGHMLSVENDSASLIVPTSESGVKRYDMVVAQLDVTNRLCKLYIKSGEPASSSIATPTYPELTRTNLIYEMGLAAILVDQGAKKITQDKITDIRMDDTYCGISGMRFDETSDVQYFWTGWNDKMEALYKSVSSTLSASQAAWLQAQIDNILPNDLTGTLSATGWTQNSDATYSQTVNFTVLSENSICYADVNLDDVETPATAVEIIDNWADIGRIKCSGGAAEFICYSACPEVDIPFRIRMVKYTSLSS